MFSTGLSEGPPSNDENSGDLKRNARGLKTHRKGHVVEVSHLGVFVLLERVARQAAGFGYPQTQLGLRSIAVYQYLISEEQEHVLCRQDK